MNQFIKLIDTDEVAAFIFEPLIQAAGGMRMYSTQLLDNLIRHAHAKNVICIADEVFTGFGRTGKLFASDYLVNKPDIMTLSKGITGGTMPLGVTTCSDKVSTAFKTFFHGHSYTGNPLACAVANASFKLLMHEDCINNIQRINSKHIEFKRRIKNHEALHEVRVLGTIIAFELRSESGSSYDHEVRKKIYPFFLERDILIRPLGNVFYILPPYIISDEQLDLTYNTIEEFLTTVTAEL
jgi:adenosylmethionine-8-amino-7-oxononanoate aminotransferase